MAVDIPPGYRHYRRFAQKGGDGFRGPPTPLQTIDFFPEYADFFVRRTSLSDETNSPTDKDVRRTLDAAKAAPRDALRKMMRASETTSGSESKSSRWFFWLLISVLVTEIVVTVLLLIGVELLFTVTVVSMAAFVIALAVSGIFMLARNRFKVRLSTFLLCSAIVAAGFGIIGSHMMNMRRQSAAVRNLQQYDCAVIYEHPPLSNVLRILALESWFARVSRVQLSSPPAATNQRVTYASKHLQSLPYRFHLTFFSNTDCTNDALKELARVPNLTGIRFGGVTVQGQICVPVSPQITDAGLGHLRTLQLTDINVAGTSITCNGLSKLEYPGALRRLGLDHTQVSDSGSDVFAAFRNLEVLSLQGTKVSDEALVYMTRIRGLRTLLLNMTNVTNAGLVSLKQLKHLEELGLGGLPLSEESIRDLQDALPECSVFR